MKLAAGFVLAGLSALVPAVGAGAESYGFTLQANIPVICVLQFQGGAGAGADGAAVALGSLREFCNAPRGYDLVVSYTPGTLRGTTIQAGNSEIVLDGSGQSTVGHSPMPRIRGIPLTASPGQNGFDTDFLRFDLRPS